MLSQLEASVKAAVTVDDVTIEQLREQEHTMETWVLEHGETGAGLAATRHELRRLKSDNEMLQKRIEQLHSRRQREEGALFEAFKHQQQVIRTFQDTVEARLADLSHRVRKLHQITFVRARTEAKALRELKEVDYSAGALPDPHAEITRLRQLLTQRDRTIAQVSAQVASNLKVQELRKRVHTISSELKRLHSGMTADDSLAGRDPVPLSSQGKRGGGEKLVLADRPETDGPAAR